MADKVGSVFFDAFIDPKGVQSGAGVINKEMKSLETGAKSMTSTFGSIGAVIAGGLMGGALIGFFKSSIQAANEANRVMAQTNAVIASTGQAAGLTASEVHAMAIEIQKTTPISDEAAQSGINMLLTFTNIGRDVLPQTTTALMDMATAMNGGVIPSSEQLIDTSKQLGKWLQDPAERMQQAIRVGVNFTQQQIEMARRMQETGDIAGAQKIVIDELGKEFGGSAAAQMETFEGKMTALKNTLNDVQEDVGNALIPSLLYLSDNFQNAEGASNGLVVAAKVLSNVLLALEYIATQVGTAIVFIFTAAWAAIHGNFDTAKGAISAGLTELGQNHLKAQQSMSKIWEAGTKKQTDTALGGFKQQSQGSADKTNKIKQDLEAETRKYEEETEKRKRMFERSMADLIWAHQDKAKQIKRDLEDENRAFSDSASEKESSFKESMEEMKLDHEDKVEKITADLAEEQAELDKKNAETTNKGQESLDQEEAAHKKKSSKIQALIDAEYAKSKNKRTSQIEELKTQLTQEQVSHEEKSARINAQIAKEIQTNKDAVQEKLESFQLEIDEENATYEKKLLKDTERYEAEKTKDKSRHDEKMAEMNLRLQEEIDILNKHQVDVDAVKDKARLDDIDRLKQSYTEQQTEAEKEHARKMADIVTKNTAAGSAGGGAFNTQMDDAMQKLKQKTDSATKNAADNMITNLSEGANKSAKEMIMKFVEGIVKGAKDALNKLVSMGVSAKNSLIGGLNEFKNVAGFAGGASNVSGGMALVGENGPELVNLPSGSEVIPNNIAFAHDRGGRTEYNTSSSQNITIYIDKVNDQQDVTAIGRELGFRAGLL